MKMILTDGRMKEFEAECVALRRIRRHRYRRARWRHMIAVRRARGWLFGVLVIIMSILLVIVDEHHDATQALLMIPAGIYMTQKGV